MNTGVPASRRGRSAGDTVPAGAPAPDARRPQLPRRIAVRIIIIVMGGAMLLAVMKHMHLLALHHGRRQSTTPAVVAGKSSAALPPPPEHRRGSKRNASQLLRYHHLFRPDQLDRAELEPCAPHTAPGEHEFLPGSWTGGSTEGGWALPFTHEAQRAIWEHQNPKDCASAKFLAVNIPASGIGGVIHVLCVGLAIAMESGRVMVPRGNFLARPEPKCEGIDATTVERCYFQPWSSCRVEDSDLRKVWIARNASVLLLAGELEPRVVAVAQLYHSRTLVPGRFRSKLAATVLQPEKHYYWWRAQAAAFLVRPNARVLQDVAERTRRTLVGPAPQPGCISVHVRHGDKGVEADVFADGMYDCAARELAALHAGKLSRQLFLSTEDPHTVQYFRGEPAAWDVTYTEVPRKPYANTSNIEYMYRIGLWEEMVNSLMNLDLALRCSAWVGAINSNWVRLIDELRSTVRCKAHLPYADVQYDDPHAMDLNW